jgi:hypothetical protein
MNRAGTTIAGSEIGISDLGGHRREEHLMLEEFGLLEETMC